MAGIALKSGAGQLQICFFVVRENPWFEAARAWFAGMVIAFPPSNSV